MCINFQPTNRYELENAFNVDISQLGDWPAEAWKDYAAPIIRSGEYAPREAIIGSYGMVPQRHIPERVKRFDTLNARAETVGEKRSYSKAWRTGQTCLVPMTRFYEPNYESGKSVRWAIELKDRVPFAVAGLWREWNEADGSRTYSFTQLTINADDHPFMSRFHEPGDEKRSLVIVPENEYDAWLNCRSPELARSFLRLYPAEKMVGIPAPLPPRRKKSSTLDLGL